MFQFNSFLFGIFIHSLEPSFDAFIKLYIRTDFSEVLTLKRLPFELRISYQFVHPRQIRVH